MASDAQRLDGAAGALLTRTIDSFTRSLADDAAIGDLIARLGLVGDAAETAATALKGSKADITTIAGLAIFFSTRSWFTP